MTVRHCDECVFYNRDPDDAEKPCTKTHSPKFFLPPNDDYGSIDWGWRRNCDDFKKDIPCTRNLGFTP